MQCWERVAVFVNHSVAALLVDFVWACLQQWVVMSALSITILQFAADVSTVALED